MLCLEILKGLVFRGSFEITGLTKFITSFLNKGLIAGPMTSDIIKECSFLISNSLPLSRLCKENVVLVLMTTMGGMELNIMPTEYSLQMIITIALFSIDQQLSKTGSFRIYLYCPVVFVASNMSLFPLLRHTMVISACLSAQRKWLLMTLVSTLILIVCNPIWLALIPFLAQRFIPFANRNNSNRQISFKCHVFILAVCAVIYLIASNTNAAAKLLLNFLSSWDSLMSKRLALYWDSISFQNNDYWAHRVSYRPAAGVFWYLEAQMFPFYAEYFSTLVSMQPRLIMAPLYLRFVGFPKHELAVMHLMVAIVYFFLLETSYVDIIFVFSLLGMHKTVLAKMKYIPWVLIGTVVPMLVSPIVTYQWLSLGTANANYLFFQGLCMWVFLAIGIIDFAGALVDDADDCKELECLSSI